MTAISSAHRSNARNCGIARYGEPIQQAVCAAPNDSKSRGRHSLMSALDHLSRGWAIVQVDPAMAMFRGITAEEEAATAVFYTLKERGYDIATKLNPWDHTQKSALVPFIIVIGNFMQASLGRLGMQLPLHVRLTSPADTISRAQIEAPTAVAKASNSLES
jgi:hypothetical protein